MEELNFDLIVSSYVAFKALRPATMRFFLFSKC